MRELGIVLVLAVSPPAWAGETTEDITVTQATASDNTATTPNHPAINLGTERSL